MYLNLTTPLLNLIIIIVSSARGAIVAQSHRYCARSTGTSPSASSFPPAAQVNIWLAPNSVCLQVTHKADPESTEVERSRVVVGILVRCKGNGQQLAANLYC